MAQLLEQKHMYGMLNGYHDKPEQPAPNATATEKAPFNNSMTRHGVARMTILLGMKPRFHVEYMVVTDATMLWEMLASVYRSMLNLNIFEMKEDHWSIKLQDCRDVGNYRLRINWKVQHYNL
jgi:hypothetical protein